MTLSTKFYQNGSDLIKDMRGSVLVSYQSYYFSCISHIYTP